MSKQWHVQQSTAEQLYEQTPDETVQLIWTDQLQVGSEHSYRDGTVADTLALIDHQQAARVAGGDEYHTLEELYEYRMLYNAHAAQGWLSAGIPVTKSWHHSDGEECFGGGWFIVTAQLPTGQVSNHYPAKDWDLFDVPWVV